MRRWIPLTWRTLRREAGLAFVAAAVSAVALRLVLGLTGWVYDVIAIGMPMLLLATLGLAAVAVLSRRAWRTAGALAGVAAVMLAIVVLPRLPDATDPPARPIVLAAANVLYDNTDPQGTVADAMAQRPDVLVVSELTKPIDDLLAPQFPYRIVTDEPLVNGDYQEGVYSRFPLERLDTPPGLDNQFVRARVQAPDPFILYGLHLPRPGLYDDFHAITFAGQREQIDALDAFADAEDEPVVIAGDLNLSDRTGGYDRLVEGRHDALRTRWAGSTFVGGWVFPLFALRIDHIVVPGSWCAANGRHFDLGASDHLGVRAEIGPCA